MVCYDMVWYWVLLHGIVGYDMVCYGMVLYDMVYFMCNYPWNKAPGAFEKLKEIPFIRSKNFMP